MTFDRPTKALPDQPDTKVQLVEIVATDADGGITRTKLTGGDINLELIAGGDGDGTWIGVRHTERKAVMQSHPLVAGSFVARGIEYAEVEYTAPEKPASLFELGDIVRIPSRVAPADYPYRNVGPVVQVKAVAWNSTEKQWGYSFLDRSGKHAFEADERKLLRAEKLDRWPLRRGDFVKVHPKHQMDDEPLKLLRRVKPGDPTYYDGLVAWWLENEAGPTNTWLKDVDAVVVDDVRVVKTVKWERG